jgi:hypothetical protein
MIYKKVFIENKKNKTFTCMDVTNSPKPRKPCLFVSASAHTFKMYRKAIIIQN